MRSDLVEFLVTLVALTLSCAALAGVALAALRIPPIRRLADRALEDPIEPGDGRDSVRDRLDILQRHRRH